MDLKKCKMLLNAAYVLGLGLVVAAFLAPEGQPFWLTLGAAAAVLLAQTVFRYKFWRCPKCGAMLGKGSTPSCPNCHWTWNGQI